MSNSSSSYAPNISLADSVKEKSRIYFDHENTIIQTNSDKLGLKTLSRELANTVEYEEGAPIKLMKMSLFPGLLLGLDFGMSESVMGVALGTPVLTMASVSLDKKTKEVVFSALKGFYKNKKDLISGTTDSTAGHTFLIIMAGLAIGFCLFKITSIVSEPREANNN